MTESKPTYCAWDGVSGPGSVHSKLIDTDWHERQRRRIGFLRNWPADGSAVALEMATRLKYWRESGRARREEAAGAPNDSCMSVLFIAIGIGLLVIIRFSVFQGYSFLVANPLWLFAGLGVLLLVGIPIDLRGRRRRRVFASLVEDTCPTCGYDLSNLAFVQIGDESVRLGPAACPECGAPWPLVPPPAVWIPDDSRES